MHKDNTYERAKEILEKLFPYPDSINEEMILGVKHMIENPNDSQLIFKRAYLILRYYLDGDGFSQDLSTRVMDWLSDPKDRDIKDKALQTIFMTSYFDRHGQQQDGQPYKTEGFGSAECSGKLYGSAKID